MRFCRLLWWAVLGVLLIGIAVMDGFDLGTAILLPWIGRTDMERRIVINTIGPVWEGNQVWLILGGGAIFAAWPPLYAVAFSGFYLAMLLLLCSLILRPVGFKFRSKLPGERWRAVWDWALFVGGLVPALVFGVAFGNVLQGVPFRFDDTLRMTYTGTLFEPVQSVRAAVRIGERGDDHHARGGVVGLQDRRCFAGSRTAGWDVHGAGGGGAVCAGWHVGRASRWLRGAIVSRHGRGVQSAGQACGAPGRGADGELRCGAMGDTGAGRWSRRRACWPRCCWPARRLRWLAFLCSGLSIAGIIATAGVSLFPFLLPSSLDPRIEPDGVGCIVVHGDAAGDDGRDRGVSADRAGVYGMGVHGYCAVR